MRGVDFWRDGTESERRRSPGPVNDGTSIKEEEESKRSTTASSPTGTGPYHSYISEKDNNTRKDTPMTLQRSILKPGKLRRRWIKPLWVGSGLGMIKFLTEDNLQGTSLECPNQTSTEGTRSRRQEELWGGNSSVSERTKIYLKTHSFSRRWTRTSL